MQKTLSVGHGTSVTSQFKLKSPLLVYHAHFIQLMEASADTNRTRSKNKNQHPGEVQNAAKRKRRTKKEMEADNAQKEARKKEKEQKTQEQIKNIASLEGEMAKKDADAESAHPRSRNGDIQILIICPDVND
jgi:hypothetical protein